jgi:hypothetical protein
MAEAADLKDLQTWLQVAEISIAKMREIVEGR